MKYWDSSALVQLLASQSASRRLARVLARDQRIITCWLTRVECWSALARLRCTGVIDARNSALAEERLECLYRGVSEVHLSEKLREVARRLLQTYALSAASAIQLAAAITWARPDTWTHEFVCSDRRLAQAAAKEGFVVLD